MKEIILIPVVFSLMFGLFVELVDVAESSSEKVLKYAESMDNALDCAFAGVPIEVCSPELSSVEFNSELERLEKTNEEIKNITQEILFES